ncbi:MAG: hypothetical protein JKP90_20835 [Desulfofustis sp. PB-SRB1]|nr:hypothetical protein [Desulfofustis sp. PB-SRB1]
MSRRTQLGLSQDSISRFCKLSKAEYGDIEGYEDELYMVVPLRVAQCICMALDMKLEELYCSNSNHNILPRNIIDIKLKEKNLSVAELSDFVGIYESSIEKIIDDILNIGDWVVDPIISLAEKLELELGSVLKSYSAYYDEEKMGSRGGNH